MSEVTFLKPFLDHQARIVIHEDECFSCGKFFPRDELADESYCDRQNGEWVNAFVCAHCKSLGAPWKD